MEKIDLTVIIPIHSVKDNNMTLFKNAITSIKEQPGYEPKEIIVVRCNCQDVKDEIDNFDFQGLNVRIVENSVSKDFATQMNIAANEVKTTYLSLLEFDDEYSKIYFKNINEWSKAYPDVDMWLPIVVEVNEQGQFLDLSNQPPWAMNFSEELGVLNNETLLNFPSFNISGMAIKTSEYKRIGGIKKSIKLTFGYEFLLRATYSGLRTMVLPKLGYKHINMRPGSLFYEYKFNPDMVISQDDAKFWVNTAKKEYFFTNDREINQTV